MSYSDRHDGWFSPGAIEVRRQSGWAAELTAKANRVFLQPILAEFGGDCTGDDMAFVASNTIEALRTKDINEQDLQHGLSDLGARLCISPPEIPSLSDELINRIFPNYGAISKRKLPDPTADPYNMFLSYLGQIGLIAAQKGWAISIAEDDVVNGGGIYSWIRPELFAQAWALDELIEPSEATGEHLWNFEDGIKNSLGADRLLFVLKRDLGLISPATAQRYNFQQEPDLSSIKRADLIPFIQRGLELIRRGDCAAQPYTIAKRVVAESGFAPKDKWTKDSGKVLASSFDAACDRLSRNLSKVLKNMGKVD